MRNGRNCSLNLIEVAEEDIHENCLRNALGLTLEQFAFSSQIVDT